MKKLLLSLGLMSILGGLITTVSASSTSCKDVEFSNGITACVNIEDAGSDRRELTTDLDEGTTSNLRCDIMTPDSLLRSVSACNGEFSYDGTKPGRIKLWIRYNNAAPEDREGKPSNSSTRTYPQWVYDFDNEERSDDDLTDNDSSDYDTDNFYLSTDDTTPSTSQRVDLTIKARDGSSTDTAYRGTINFEVYYRSSSSSSWTKTTSSTYYEMDSDYEDDGYTFTSSNKGLKTLSDFIRFKKTNYSYKVVVVDEDDEDITGERTFTVGSSSSSDYDTDNFYLSTDDTTPSTSQRVDLTIKARDGSSTDTAYRGTINFEVYYRSSSSSSWTKTTSSTYYEMDSDYEDDGYTFTSSNRGLKTLSDFIRFKKTNYSYKVVVVDEDDEDILGEKIFTVGTANSSSNSTNYNTNNLYITTDDTTPTTSQYVDLTIKARDETVTDTTYRGTVQFEIYYKASGSSTWTQTTSSTYYTMSSTYKTNGYTFTSSNRGLKTITDLIKFNKTNYSYKIVVYDEDYEDIQGYTTFTVGSVSNSSSNSSVDGFTSSELATVESIYDKRDGMISDLKSKYSKLRNSTRRNTMSENLYTAMQEIIDDENDKTYDNFDDFNDAWLERYRYTISIR